MARAMSAGGQGIAWYIGASSGMPPISGENTSMKAMLDALIAKARWAATESRCVSQTAKTVTRITTGTISEMSRSQTASLLAKSE